MLTSTEKMGLIDEDKSITFLESNYIKTYNQNKKSIKKRTEWKTTGSDAKFIGMADDLS